MTRTTTCRLLATLAVLGIALGGCTASSIKFAPSAKTAAAATSVMSGSSGAAPIPAVRSTASLAPLPPGAASAYVALPQAGAGVEGLISEYASAYAVPESLVRRVVHRESKGNPGAKNGPYMGLMQIRTDTAQSMGYRGGSSGLLDARTNLQYGVKYLRGAYLVADGDEDRAMKLYASGYYYHAKAKGLLEETGLR